MYIQKFLTSSTGKYIMSIILGFGLATLFRSSCKEERCEIKRAPDFNKIKDKIYQHGDKCYTYDIVPNKCNPLQKQIKI